MVDSFQQEEYSSLNTVSLNLIHSYSDSSLVIVLILFDSVTVYQVNMAIIEIIEIL